MRIRSVVRDVVRVSVLCAIATACGGGFDGPSAPTGAPTLRASDPVFVSTQVTLSVRNAGGAGEGRVRLFWSGPAGGFAVLTCATSAPFTLAAGATTTRTTTCDGGEARWAVVESRDANGTWRRTACVARATPCPDVLLAER